MSIQVIRKKRDAYQHGDLREALVQAGLKLLSEDGLAGLSLRAAAQLAGVSHAAPYRHFRDKQALVAAIAERGFRMLTASMRAELARCTSTDAQERLGALGAGYVKFATKDPAYLQVIFGGVHGTGEVPPALSAAGDEAYGTLRAVVESGIATGQLRNGDPDQLSLACWSLVHGLSTLLINGAIRRPPTAAAERKLVEGLLRLLGEGLGTGAPSSTSGTSPSTSVHPAKATPRGLKSP
jgi:AcrR family transcriptional regulator